VFAWSAPASGCYDIDTFGSAYDTTLHVHQPCPAFDEIRCDDDSGNGEQSKITLDLPAGQPLSIVVDGYDTDSTGEFVLNINPCVEDCADFDDNDLDGLWDCDDPDCAEHTQCVPEICDNGRDDDADGLIDCEDEECAILSECGDCQQMVDSDLGSAIGPGVATGSTIGAGRDFEATCGAGTDSEDRSFSWMAPTSGCYSFDTLGSDYDTVLHAYGQCPAMQELACEDDIEGRLESRVLLEVDEGESILLVVDGYGDASSGEYVLNVQECNEDCANGLDDDLDGLTDCSDVDCQADSACIPEDCGDGLDNDGDGDVDCADDECADLDECFSCPMPDFDLGSETGTAIAVGSTVGAGADFSASCAGGSLSEDVLFSWVAPNDGCFVMTTDGSNFDTSLHVHGPCPNFVELECDDDSGQLERSTLEIDAVEGELFFIVVDGYSRASSGDYELSIFDCP
jgi:hypothetical protein